MRSISLVIASFSCARIARQPYWTPAYHDGSKMVQSKIAFPIMTNSHIGGNGNGRKDTFRVVAWGGYADSIAVCGSIGQALDLVCTQQSYLGRLYDQNDQLVLRTDGQAMLVEKVVFKIDKLCFGEESAKHVTEEIQKGKRPVHWNDPSHADNAIWKEIMAARRKHVWAKGDPAYGCAKVTMPNGNYTLAIDMPNQPGQGAVVGNYGATEQAVQNVANNLPAQGQPAAQYQGPPAASVSAGQQLF